MNQQKTIDEAPLLPNFLIIGAMKSGTTSLYDDLATHPDVWLPSKKEPDILHKYNQPDQISRHYRLHFAGAKPGQVLGEASTMYTMTPWFPDVSAIARKAMGPNLKIIYIMRDPVKRILSHLAHDFSSGRVSSTNFDRLVFEECRYINISDYALQLAPWVEQFGTEKILCVEFEQYIKDRESVTKQVAEFIGLNPDHLKERKEISNPKGNARSFRLGILKKIQQSSIYKYHLSRYIHPKLTNLLKKTLTKNKEVPDIQLSQKTMTELQERFSQLPNQLAALGLGNFSWPTE